MLGEYARGVSLGRLPRKVTMASFEFLPAPARAKLVTASQKNSPVLDAQMTSLTELRSSVATPAAIAGRLQRMFPISSPAECRAFTHRNSPAVGLRREMNRRSYRQMAVKRAPLTGGIGAVDCQIPD